MTCGFVSFLRKTVVLVDFYTRCLASLRGIAGQMRVSNDEVNFSLKADDIVLVQVLQSGLPIIVKLTQRFVVHHTWSTGETFEGF